MSAKVKIITPNLNFFNLNWGELAKIAFNGVILALTCWLLTSSIFKVDYHLVLILGGVMTILSMAFAQIKRSWLIVLSTILVVWQLEIIFNWWQNLLLLTSTFVLLFLFFGWISQLNSFKLTFSLVVISLIMLI